MVYFEAASTANKRLRADEHHQQDDEERDSGWVCTASNEPEETRSGREQPLGRGVVVRVDDRIVDDDRGWLVWSRGFYVHRVVVFTAGSVKIGGIYT